MTMMFFQFSTFFFKKKNNISSLFFFMNLFILLIFCFFFKNNVYLNDLFHLNNWNKTLIFLNFFLTKIILMNNFLTKNPNNSLTLMSSTICTLFFLSNHIIMTFFFYETVMFPILFMIISMSNYPERQPSSLYLFCYISFFSLPFLMYMYILKKQMETFTLTYNFYMHFTNTFFFLKKSIFINFISTMLFFVKIPIFPLHTWLLKAHVEAPTPGSMLLAGILMKLSTYGLMILLRCQRSLDFFFYMKSAMTLSLLGCVLSSLMCFFLQDLKMIIAMSSVLHMNFMLSSLLNLSLISMKSTWIIMFSHGLCASNLFFLISIFYKFNNSRNFFINKNMQTISSTCFMIWFLLLLANLGTPPFMSFLSETMIFFTLMKFSLMFVPLIFFFSLLFSTLTIFLNNSIFLNKPWVSYKMLNFNKIEKLSIMTQLIPLIFFFFNIYIFFPI